MTGLRRRTLTHMLGLILVLIGVLLSSAACLKPVSIEDQGYVVSVGIDRGKEKKYYITLMLQRESSGQSSAVPEGGAIVLAAEGENIFEAIGAIKSNIPYTLNFSRTNFIFFSTEAAEEGLAADFLEVPLDTLRIRASSIVIITEGSVGEFIGGLAANNDANITKLQNAILLDRDKTGMASVMSVSRMYEACTEGRFDFCCALGAYDERIITDMSQKKSEGEGEDPVSDAEPGDRVGGLKSHITGTAVFNGWIMSAALDRHETLLLNMVLGDFKMGTFAFDTEDGRTVTVQLQSDKTQIKFLGFDESGAPCFSAEVYLLGGLHQTSPAVTVREAEEWMNAKVAQRFESELYELFEKCRLASSDAMRLGTVISKEFSSAKEWEAFNWKQRYPDSKVTFRVIIKAVDKYAAEGMQ